MNKKLMIGVAAGFAAVEEMPEDFPPLVMFDNVEATKANSEEILTLLRHEGSKRADVDALAST